MTDPVPPVALEALRRIKAAFEHMDRAGGDAYAMPECPWCHAQGSQDGDDNYHTGDCELAAARETVVELEAVLSAEPRQQEPATPEVWVKVIQAIAVEAMTAQSDPHAEASRYRNALIGICNMALKAQEATEPRPPAAAVDLQAEVKRLIAYYDVRFDSPNNRLKALIKGLRAALAAPREDQ